MFLLAASQVESVPAAASATANASVQEVAAAAGAVGAFVAVSLTTILIFEVIWLILQIIADWKIFAKADVAGWKSIIPIVNTFVEYDICWSGIFGLLFLITSFIFSFMSGGEGAPMWKTILSSVCGIIAVILHLIQSMKLSKAFDHGIGMGLVLFFFGPIGRMILGFGSSKYVGYPD